MTDKETKLKEIEFCVTCASDVTTKEEKQFHLDVGHKTVLKKEVNFDNDKAKDERKDSKKLYDFANKHISKTVISTYDSSKVYGLVEVHDHSETLELNSNRAIQWLSHEYHKIDQNTIHSSDFFKNSLYAIVSNSQMNGTINEKVHTRIAQTDDSIYYDLGSKDWQAVKITKKSISSVKLNEKTPLFIRPSSLYEQIRPSNKYKDGLDDLTKLLLILEQDKIIFKCHLVALFLENIAVPMPVAIGSAGSSKSTFTAYLKLIVDPSGKHRENNLIGFPKKKEDLVAIQAHRYMIGYDNVSEIDQEMSDELCRSVTGGSSANRKLYTNSDESITSYKNKLVLNGIVPRLNYPDLQTRIITYPRKPLDKSNTLSEQKLDSKFNFLLKYVLGNIFTTLKKALNLYPKISDEINPSQRMADFEVWGEVIAQCLGYEPNEFIRAYDRKLKEDVINQKDQHIIVNLIEILMEEKEVYEKEAKTLLNELKFLAKNEDIDIKDKYVYFPKMPNHLTRELTIADPILKRLGYFVEVYPYNKRDNKFKRGSKIVRISRKNQGLQTFEKLALSALPSLSDDNQARKSQKTDRDLTSMKKTTSVKSRSKKGLTEMAEMKKKPSLSKNRKIRHKKGTGRDDSDDRATLKKVSNDNQEYFKCITHNAGIFHISEKSKSSGNILEFHKRQNCEIKYFSKKEE